MVNNSDIIQSVVQELNAVGERIGQAIDAATADMDVQLLEEVLTSLSETRARLQGKTPVTEVSATVVPLRP
ncbi:hypothetical protein [Providencia sp. PROV255]|uniref:hypothetical protein n=1 Tax=Providencia sp. PROV255 TaxID=2949943 RepID=UPI00234B2F58|nr:hypothetical protein [Providencia sp. PROV255]